MGDWLPGAMMLIAVGLGAVGVFMIYVPAGWIFLCAGFTIMAWVAGRGNGDGRADQRP